MITLGLSCHTPGRSHRSWSGKKEVSNQHFAKKSLTCKGVRPSAAVVMSVSKRTRYLGWPYTVTLFTVAWGSSEEGISAVASWPRPRNLWTFHKRQLSLSLSHLTKGCLSSISWSHNKARVHCLACLLGRCLQLQLEMFGLNFFVRLILSINTQHCHYGKCWTSYRLS